MAEKMAPKVMAGKTVKSGQRLVEGCLWVRSVPTLLKQETGLRGRRAHCSGRSGYLYLKTPCVRLTGGHDGGTQ